MCYKQAVSTKNDNYFTLKMKNISASFILCCVARC